MKKLVLIAGVFALASCGEEAAPVEEAPVEEEETVTERPAMEDIELEGSWNLVGFAAESIPATVNMTITATGDRFAVRSSCANMSWPYTVNGNIIETGEGSGDKSGCAGDRTTWEYSIAKIVRDANIVMSAGENQISMSGPGGSMTLEKAG
ncbi:META domain-containing protein [Sphingomicrobium clamense]|uniref:META domain-containing protein n=1 Tax=Sphingomicrobium clamense TaxID=2851013 RepID=A0ABS6V2W4_9SPHN|nr:META domain-containing protein [Sphingomicrobium sp. B8]MBW0143898.1 META domain-containing protein [Sphingomicrobium sp. B8]